MLKKSRQRPKIPKIRLIKRREIWTLTLWGWGIASILVASLIFFIITHVQPFLAVTSPIKSAELLVVEGWLPDYAIQQALTEFKSGAYRQIITTGGTIDKGSYLIPYKNFAEVSALTFKKLGLETDKVIAVPTPFVIKDRSYESAAEFGRWLSKANFQIESINLFSGDVHTRRSWLLFKKVLAPKIKVGVIAAKTQDYNPNKWWVSSQGVRSVINEIIAYIYAQFVNWKA
ncbi:MAG: YdcF family protein [Gloeotrichia echinulata DVL01]|jgi:hypothetical protein|nr:YdcF family protein [Gloeotrichia echinulata DEX184]